MHRGRRGVLCVSAFALASLRCSLLVDTSALADEPTTVAGEGGVSPEADAAVGLLDGGTDEASKPADARKAFPDGATVWPANGHAYLVVTSSTAISWAEANAAAVALGGHLATVGSAEENDFVFALGIEKPGAWVGNYGPWLGGIQREDGSEPEGGWAWITGEPWTFSAWFAGEPNEANAKEDYLGFFSTANPRTATWCDSRATVSNVRSYIVELE